LTGSRGGVAATFVGILVLALLAAIRARNSAGFGLLAAGLTVGAAFLIYGDFLRNRLLTEGLVAPDRSAVYRLTWRSILDAPIFGFGDDSFQAAFAMYHDKSIIQEGSWDHAHNSYLEVLQGLGVPMAAVLLAGLLGLMRRCIYGALTRRNFALAPVASSVAAVIVATHAFVDFSVQMQAVALTWIAMLGAGVAQSWSSKIATDR
jgi:O-antigen ligase